MKLKFMVLGLSLLLLNSVQPIAADEKESTIKEMNEEKADKFCPICGPEEAMAGKDDITYEYEGKTYYFCSLGCLDAFKKSPEKYSKISEENHEGHDDDKGHDHADHGSHEGHDYK